MPPLTGTGLLVTDAAGKTKVRVDVPIGDQVQMRPSPDETILLNGASGNITLKVDGNPRMALTAGSPGQDLPGGPTLTLRSIIGKETIDLNGNEASLTLRNNVSGQNTVFLDGNRADLFLGGGRQDGNVTVRDGVDADIVVLRAGTGEIAVGGGNKQGSVRVQDENGADIVVLRAGSAEIAVGGGNKHGKVRVQNGAGADTLFLDGEKGDIALQNADCAEDFDVSQSAEVEPGTVVVIDEEGKLRPSQQPYDKKVAGVISGAGNCRPGLILDKKESQPDRLPVALVGKVYCKVDAQYSAIELGDLLTTSATPGHAMKASDPVKAFGAVIGKALRPLSGGMDLIPILIALQ